MSVNLLTSYANQLDNKLTVESFTKAHAKGEVRFIDVKAGIIEVLTPTTVTPSDYKISDKNDRYGGITEMGDSKATYQVSNDKSFKLGLDEGNKKGQANLKQAGEMLKLQIREQITPMMDKVYFAKLVATATATSQKIIHVAKKSVEEVATATEYLDEALAPASDRILFVSSEYRKDIRNEITTTMNAPQTNDKLVSKGIIGELDGFTVVKVPKSYFPANVLAIAVWTGAVSNAAIINEARVKTDSEMLSGDLLIGRYKFDTFVQEAKKNTIAVIATA